MGALGRSGGGGTSPKHSPTGSLCQLPPPPAPSPEARGWDLSGHREVGVAQGRLQGRLPQTPHSPEQVSGGLVPPPGRTPRTSACNHREALFAFRFSERGVWGSPGRVFTTPFPPSQDPLGVALDGTGLGWGVHLFQKFWSQCLGTPRTLPSRHLSSSTLSWRPCWPPLQNSI